jgi:glycosyltransferase involved in cell wall biosynthesis
MVIADFPRPNQPSTSVFNQRCANALRKLGHRVEVMAHRPYAPALLSYAPRWSSWIVPTGSEFVDGIAIHRPAYLQIPRVGSAFWIDTGAFFWCRRTARELYRRIGFDAIVSFDLLAAGGIAWRIGKDLGIPASGWAFGSDMRQPPGSSLARVVSRAITHLDLVFYQSRDLFEIAARKLGISPEAMAKDKHVVLPHGIPEPPAIQKTETRNRVRSILGIRDDQILVLTVASFLREKGVFELLKAILLVGARDARVRFVMLGSRPAFDETTAIKKTLDDSSLLNDRVKLLSACSPEKVWEYLYAADIFAFPSHNEGMPNSLLEAMAVGLPSIAFAIPPIREIEAETGGLVLIPPLDVELFSEAILRLAASPAERTQIAEKGKAKVMERFMVDKNMAEMVRRVAQIVDRRRDAISLAGNEVGTLDT